jgi:hypothetical protein
MYIEFAVDRSVDKEIQQYILSMVSLSIYDWEQQYQIPTQKKRVKNRLNLCFSDDALYSFFLMTFEYTFNQVKINVVTDPNNR